MTKAEMLHIVYAYLSTLMGCEIADFSKAEPTFSVCNTVESYLKILLCGNATIVRTSSNLSSKVAALIKGKSKDELFECPLVYGQTIHYIPDSNYQADTALPVGYTYSLFQGEEIQRLSYLTGFDNALVFDCNGHTNSAIAFVAYKDGMAVAVAGASIVHDNLWEVGIDVLPASQRNGLATSMIRKLTSEILQKGAVPFYSASITNIGSQMVAARAGYLPCWVDSWGHIFDDYYPYDLSNITK